MGHPQNQPELQWLEDLAKQTGAFAVLQRKAAMPECDWDVEVRPTAGGPPIHLLLEAKRSATPHDVLRLPARKPNGRPTRVPVLCSPVISSRVADLCRSSNIGYLDAAGNCHIAARNFFVHVEGRKNPHRVAREAVDLFAEKSSRVTRVLLSDPKHGWQVQKVAQEAGISLGLASRLKRKLVDQAYAELRDGLLFVRDAHALLQAWAGAYSLPARQQWYVMSDARRIEQKIAEWCSATRRRYALTGFAGAWRVAPMVRHSVPSIYVEASELELSELKSHLAAKAVEDGANLHIWIPTDDYVFYGMRTVDKRHVVSAIQLYLDLSAIHGRGKEAAAEVLEKEISIKWQS